jgi:hypothetical protein
MLSLPYGFYSFLRVIICLSAGVGFIRARASRQANWLWIYGALAILYNPVLPVHLALKPLWIVINLVTISLLWIGLRRMGDDLRLPDAVINSDVVSKEHHPLKSSTQMEEPGEVQIVPPPVTTDMRPRLSIWRSPKRFGLKRLFIVSLGIGVGLGIVIAMITSVAWLTSRTAPAPAPETTSVREWPRVELKGVGLKAKLKTDGNDSRYQLVIAPMSDDAKAVFDKAVRSHRDSISFAVHLYDKAGFELCKTNVKVTPVVNAEPYRRIAFKRYFRLRVPSLDLRQSRPLESQLRVPRANGEAHKRGSRSA